MIKKKKMTNKVYYQLLFVIFFQKFHCLIINPAIGILTESNLYLAQIIEFNYTNDEFYLIYHHNDPVYSLQSFTSNHFLHQIYICSPNTIYTLDLQIESTIIPLLPIDNTPCRSSLTYLSNETTLLWALRHAIIQLDFQQMSREFLWNSTSIINDMIYNDTIDDNYIHFYLSIQITDYQSSILHCQTNRHLRIFSYQSCRFIDNGYHEISTLAIDKNFLYVADRIEQKIYVLTLLSNGSILKKTILPVNTSIIADIRSMFIHNQNLIWLTTSGHVRIVSLKTYEVRNLFWFDEQLRTIRLVSFSQWPNQTTTSRSSTKTIISSTSASEQIDITTIDNNPWKTTAYITSIILGITLFLCAAMITCVLINYRPRRIVPNSFTNIYHILRDRTRTTARPILDESLT
jgi:hypothetical protein